MTGHGWFPRTQAAWLVLALVVSAAAVASAQQSAASSPPQLGGSYSGLDSRRKVLVDDWATRLNTAVGTKAAPEVIYDQHLPLSIKTTFDAITWALERSTLTDASGQPLGTALDVIAQVETVRGQIMKSSGDRQFRMYAVLKPDTLDRLDRSREFKRGADNTVYHQGYPLSYRQQGGSPSIQISMTPDGRRADIDVDYRSSSFPLALFNGHLTASNSDVRAGNNYERHSGRWNGFQNWWRSFFGIGIDGRPPDAAEDAVTRASISSATPRAGDQKVELMMEDFLKAWLIEGNIIQAMPYVAPRSYACMAQDSDDPASFDRGVAPFVLARNLKAAYDAIGPHASLEGLTVGVNLPLPALRVVKQPRHAQFVAYSVPDDVAGEFDCESRLRLGDPKQAQRKYGTYFGTVFNINTPRGRGHSVALLWARTDGYWKIVSWRSEPVGDDWSQAVKPPDVKTATVKADPTLVNAARDFLESWLLEKDYDAAFRYVSPKAYACYNLTRDPAQPAAATPEEGGGRIRQAIQHAGDQVGKRRSVDEVVEGLQPFHPQIQIASHRYSRTFSLSSVPTNLAEWADCGYRAAGGQLEKDSTPEYGKAFGMNVRFKTAGGEPPVLRLLWEKEADAWRITAYDVEVP